MPNSTVGVDISKTHLDVYVVPAALVHNSIEG